MKKICTQSGHGSQSKLTDYITGVLFDFDIIRQLSELFPKILRFSCLREINDICVALGLHIYMDDPLGLLKNH